MNRSPRSESGTRSSGIDIQPTHGVTDDGADELGFTVTMKKGSTTEGEIVIRFGSHVLRTPFVAKID